MRTLKLILLAGAMFATACDDDNGDGSSNPRPDSGVLPDSGNPIPDSGNPIPDSGNPGDGGLKPCIEANEDLARPPASGGPLPCDMLPPTFGQ